MQYDIQRADERGRAEHGWLSSRFSFSFADYLNQDRMGFGALRVINDDLIAPGGKFGMHPHRDMEIITIILKGSIEHNDSMGNGYTLREGEVQHMSAGSGIRHSEANPSQNEALELFQIWIYPKSRGITPEYQQKRFGDPELHNRLCLLVSGTGEADSLPIHQDARIYRGQFDTEELLSYRLSRPGHGLYIMMIDGEASLLGEKLLRRDAMALEGYHEIDLAVGTGSDILLFDLPMQP